MGELLKLFYELIKLAPALIPLIRQIIDLIKSHPQPVQTEALEAAHSIVKRHCEGVACEAELKKD
jgi:hypothetical protein